MFTPASVPRALSVRNFIKIRWRSGYRFTTDWPGEASAVLEDLGQLLLDGNDEDLALFVSPVSGLGQVGTLLGRVFLRSDGRRGLWQHSIWLSDPLCSLDDRFFEATFQSIYGADPAVALLDVYPPLAELEFREGEELLRYLFLPDVATSQSTPTDHPLVLDLRARLAHRLGHQLTPHPLPPLTAPAELTGPAGLVRTTRAEHASPTGRRGINPPGGSTVRSEGASGRVFWLPPPTGAVPPPEPDATPGAFSDPAPGKDSGPASPAPAPVPQSADLLEPRPPPTRGLAPAPEQAPEREVELELEIEEEVVPDSPPAAALGPSQLTSLEGTSPPGLSELVTLELARPLLDDFTEEAPEPIPLPPRVVPGPSGSANGTLDKGPRGPEELPGSPPVEEGRGELVERPAVIVRAVAPSQVLHGGPTARRRVSRHLLWTAVVGVLVGAVLALVLLLLTLPSGPRPASGPTRPGAQRPVPAAPAPSAQAVPSPASPPSAPLQAAQPSTPTGVAEPAPPDKPLTKHTAPPSPPVTATPPAPTQAPPNPERSAQRDAAPWAGQPEALEQYAGSPRPTLVNETPRAWGSGNPLTLNVQVKGGTCAELKFWVTDVFAPETGGQGSPGEVLSAPRGVLADTKDYTEYSISLTPGDRPSYKQYSSSAQALRSYAVCCTDEACKGSIAHSNEVTTRFEY